MAQEKSSSKLLRTPYVTQTCGRAIVKSRIALLIAVPLIVAIVLILTFLGFFSSYVVIAVLVVLYLIVSWANRRKFARQEQEQARQTTK